MKNMLSFTSTLAFIFAATLFTSDANAMQEMAGNWKSGLSFSSDDGNIKIGIGGRLQIDHGFFSEEDGVDQEQDGVEMRRSRLAVSGLIGGNVEFKTQYDFAGGDADFKDAWIGLKEAGFLGKVRVGQQFEPMGLETLTSSKYITFAERSFTTALLPGRNTGILSSHSLADDLGTLAFGYFRDVNSSGNGQEDGQGSLSARATYLPIYQDGGTQLLHLGASISSRDTSGGVVDYHADSLSHLGADIVDTGDVLSDGTDLFGAELAYVQGPMSVQAEFVSSTLDDDSEVTAWYLQGSYFLSGESRSYKKSAGAFARVKPASNYGDDGNGAIELAIRLQEIDLDEMAAGENAEALSMGINWHLNPNTRVMFNVINASPDEASAYGSDVTSYVMRFAVNF